MAAWTWFLIKYSECDAACSRKKRVLYSVIVQCPRSEEVWWEKSDFCWQRPGWCELCSHGRSLMGSSALFFHSFSLHIYHCVQNTFTKHFCNVMVHSILVFWLIYSNIYDICSFWFLKNMMIFLYINNIYNIAWFKPCNKVAAAEALHFVASYL